MRYERRSKSISSLRDYIDSMTTIVERRRQSMDIDKSNGRTLKDCVAVMIWTEEDGTETVTVAGDNNVTALEIKGLLHDGLYAIAHQGEEGWAPTP